MPYALPIGMSPHTILTYQVDAGWHIVEANEAFCRTFHCTRSSLIGRDVRELLRVDWRVDFRNYVVRALVGVGESNVTLPLVAPCGTEAWFNHELEPMMDNRRLAGFRATLQPRAAKAQAVETKRWWNWHPVVARQVWDFDADQLGTAN